MMMRCGRCGADVQGANATAVEALTVAGTLLCSVLCADCARVLKAGKYPGVSMRADGRLEAIPSVPANDCDKLGEHGCGVHCGPCDFDEFNRADCPYHQDNVHARAQRVFGKFGHCGGPTQNRPYTKTEVDDLCTAHEKIVADVVSKLGAGSDAYTCAPEMTFQRGTSNPDAVRFLSELEEALRERLAAYAHEAWAGWMRHLFEKGDVQGGGGHTIRPSDVERWRRQKETPYAELPDAEKASDRAQADKILAILRGEE